MSSMISLSKKSCFLVPILRGSMIVGMAFLFLRQFREENSQSMEIGHDNLQDTIIFKVFE